MFGKVMRKWSLSCVTFDQWMNYQRHTFSKELQNVWRISTKRFSTKQIYSLSTVDNEDNIAGKVGRNRLFYCLFQT